MAVEKGAQSYTVGRVPKKKYSCFVKETQTKRKEKL
jgi:hypothetical protein